MNKRWLWLILVLALQMLYFPINRLAHGGVMLQTALDAHIPLLPIFTVPYLLALPWWLGSLVWATVAMPKPLFRALICAALLVILSGTLVYILYPTYVTRSPVTAQGWSADLLRFIYQNDRTYNAFPSSHTYLTTLICLFWLRWKPGLHWLWVLILTLVLLSTLFTGQHTLPDVIGGLVLAVAGYALGLHLAQNKAEP